MSAPSCTNSTCFLFFLNDFPSVYALKERCLQVVRKLVKKEDVSALGSEIPKSLQEDLVHPKPTQVLWTTQDVEDDEES